MPQDGCEATAHQHERPGPVPGDQDYNVSAAGREGDGVDGTLLRECDPGLARDMGGIGGTVLAQVEVS